MTREILYDMAFRYKKSALWKKLWDSEIFALKLSNGEIGYVCVLGRHGDYFALGLYVGDQGYRSYCKLADFGTFTGDEFVDHERILSQKCLQLALKPKVVLRSDELDEVRAYARKHGIRLAGRNAFPQFAKYEPNHIPWTVQSEEDMQMLFEAAEAALLLNEELKKHTPYDLGIYKLGFGSEDIVLFEVKGGTLFSLGRMALPVLKEEGPVYVEAESEVMVAALKKLCKKGTWEAELIRSLHAVRNEPNEAPYFPLMLLVVESESGFIVNLNIVKDEDGNPQELLQSFVDGCCAFKQVCKKMRCKDERTYALLKDLCRKVGIKANVYKQRMPALEEAKEGLLDFMIDDVDAEESMDVIVDMIYALLSMDKREIAMMPREIRDQLIAVLNSGIIPPELEMVVRNKLR